MCFSAIFTNKITINNNTKILELISCIVFLTLLVTILFASFGSSNAQAASTFESSLPCINYKELYSLSIDETYTYDEVLADMLHCGVLSKNDI